MTKKEIDKEIKCTKNAGYNYSAKVRGYNFESIQSELYEEDEEGKLTFLTHVHNKKDVVNAILSWFYEYASQEL